MGQLGNSAVVLKCLSSVGTQGTELCHAIPSRKQLLLLPSEVTFESNLEQKNAALYFLQPVQLLSVGLLYSLGGC